MIKWGKFTISAGTLLPLALPFQKKVKFCMDLFPNPFPVQSPKK